MLKVQEYLLKNSLEQLEKDYAINIVHSPIGEPLVILNYDQIDSPKYSPITRECRGLVLDTTDWSVVAKPFSRFFNYGESREEINNFDWKNFSTLEKHDGSLAIVYNYRGTWRVNTRGSFGLGKVGESQFNWEELFYQTIDETGLDDIHEDCTLVFELCSIHNKIMRTYLNPTSYLLAAFNRKTLEEIPFKQEGSVADVRSLAQVLRCGVPSLLTFGSIEEVIAYLEKDSLEPTFEGFVLRDSQNHRMKVKNKNYLRLHRMRDNNNLFAPKNLIPFILSGELDELFAIYPETKNHVKAYQDLLNQHLTDITEVYSVIHNRNTQKSFALKAQEMCPRWTSILFTCRKTQESVSQVWRKSDEYILKVLDNELTKLYSKTIPNPLETKDVQ
jgi:RNA ligase